MLLIIGLILITNYLAYLIIYKPLIDDLKIDVEFYKLLADEWQAMSDKWRSATPYGKLLNSIRKESGD